MSFDARRNFAKSNFAGIAAGGLSLTVAAGDGAKFPLPESEGAFNAVIWNLTDYPDPADDPSVEMVRVTARTGDVLTVTRGQEGTSDVDHNTGGKTYCIAHVFSAKVIDDIAAAIPLPPETGTISGTEITVSENIGYVLGLYINGSLIHPNLSDWSFANKVITISAAMAAGFAGQAYTVIYTKA